ncbi:MAG: hypothetical protein IIY79_08360 [Ruminococcus sp.]|nr:hypothetical protein [Ruminococcus sp.]
MDWGWLISVSTGFPAAVSGGASQRKYAPSTAATTAAALPPMIAIHRSHFFLSILPPLSARLCSFGSIAPFQRNHTWVERKSFKFSQKSFLTFRRFQSILLK